MVKCKKARYEVSYFDPKDPNAMREKTWKFKSIKEARKQQEDLKVVWEEKNTKNFPIKEVCLKR